MKQPEKIAVLSLNDDPFMGHRDHPATKSHFANSNPMQSMAPFCFTDAISTHFGHFARQRDETIPECRNIFPTLFQRGKCSSLNCRVTGRRELNFVNFVNFSHGRGCASLSFRFQLLPLRGKKSNIPKKKIMQINRENIFEQNRVAHFRFRFPRPPIKPETGNSWK